MKRSGPPKRRTPLKPVGRRARRQRARKEVFGPLADFARAKGCQAKVWAPGPCWGRIGACHARSRGAGFTDWYMEPGGEMVGNVFGGCAHHHQWSDEHKAEAMLAMRACAWRNGREFTSQ